MSPDQPTNSTTYATILVAAGTGENVRHRLALSFGLAERFSSYVIGIAAQELQLPYYPDGAIARASDIIEQEMKEATHGLQEAEETFRKAARDNERIEWRCAMTSPLTFLVEQARAADIVVVGSPGALVDAEPGTSVDAGEAAMAVGRPLLVVPPGVSQLRARSVVVAWKSCREARRAVLDSLPLLQAADEVCVVMVGEDADEIGGKDTCAFLARHGVKSRLSVRPSSTIMAGDEILRAASQARADLIVSGAYGHSRMREWAFGGVTRHLLHNAHVPCLFSH